jgi:phosphoenolpyruvate phosphomutase
MTMRKSTKLREMFKNEGIIRLIGAHDGIGAKLVELNGFEGIWASGLEISASYAVPDANILTMTQYLERAEEMNNAVSIPVVADCDTGYGNANNVIFMVKQYEAAGIAGVCIEDKKFPKVNSYIPGRQELAPIGEFVGKIMAAKSTQVSPDFMVIARVEALIAGWGQEEALKRAHAYVDAGADAVLIHSKAKTPEEVFTFIDAWKNRAPVVVVPTAYPDVKEDELAKKGVKVVIYANVGIRSRVRVANEVLSTLEKAKKLVSVYDDIAPMKEIFDLQGMTEMKREESKYLRSDREPITVIIPAAGAPKNQPDIEGLLSDFPVGMLNVYGKPILQRNVETFNNLGVTDINIVTGYKADSVNIEGAHIVRNPDYDKTHILDSIFNAEDSMKGKTVISYADLLFESSLLDHLLKQDEDIVLVVDSTGIKTGRRNKKLDLVTTKFKPVRVERVFTSGRLNPVVRIGKRIPLKDATHEFIGLSLFSKKGIEIFKEAYHRAKKECSGGKFHEAPSFEKASLTDILQEIIDSGQPVSALEVASGWMEIHSFEDYKKASSVLEFR